MEQASSAIPNLLLLEVLPVLGHVALIAGGELSGSSLSTVELYSPEGGCQYNLAALPKALHGLSMTISSTYITACSGTNPIKHFCLNFAPRRVINHCYTEFGQFFKKNRKFYWIACQLQLEGKVLYWIPYLWRNSRVCLKLNFISSTFNFT